MTDQNLISLLETKPEEGVRMVLCLYGKAIKTICSNILRGASKEDVEEAAADAVAAIWQSGRRFQSGTRFGKDTFSLETQLIFSNYITAIANTIFEFFI